MSFADEVREAREPSLPGVSVSGGWKNPDAASFSWANVSAIPSDEQIRQIISHTGADPDDFEWWPTKVFFGENDAAWLRDPEDRSENHTAYTGKAKRGQVTIVIRRKARAPEELRALPAIPAREFPRNCATCARGFTHGRVGTIHCSAACRNGLKGQPVNTIRHVVIPDTQVRPGEPTDHLVWAGQWIREHCQDQPTRIVHLDDHWDMPSLSSYDKGKRAAEGRRVRDDLEAGNRAFEVLDEAIGETPLDADGLPLWTFDLTFGNHPERILRYVEDHPELDGFLSLDNCVTPERWRRHAFLMPVELDGIYYCLAPSNRVLRADLQWVELGKLEPGEELVGFDAMDAGGGPRKYKKSTVLAADRIVAPTANVRLSDGRTIVATYDHRWLARRHTTGWQWVHTRDLTAGTELCQPFETWDQEATHDAGYLGGILDGEGHLSKPNGAQGGIQLGFAQNEGIVLSRTLALLDAWGFDYSTHRPLDCTRVLVKGPSSRKLELLGRTGAARLIDKFEPEMLGRVQQVHPVYVESVTDNGLDEVVQLATSSETFIAEGLAHHNCHYFYQPNTGRPFAGENIEARIRQVGHSFVMGHQQGLRLGATYDLNGAQRLGVVAGSFYQHDEDYKGPQGNHHWRGIVVLNGVKDGSADPMPLSLDYLCRSYAGHPISEHAGIVV